MSSYLYLRCLRRLRRYQAVRDEEWLIDIARTNLWR